jgi:hypothetical protein
MNWIISKKIIGYVFVLGASWRNPATYTIGKVLDFVFVETTSTLYEKRSSTMSFCKLYD